MSSTTLTTRPTKSWDHTAVALMVIAGLTALIPVVSGVAMIFQHTVSVPEMMVDVAPGAAGIGHAHDIGEGVVDVEGLSPWVRLLLAVEPVGQGLSGAACAWLLVGLLRSISAGHPFTEANTRRLSVISLLCIVVSLLLPQIGLIARMAVMSNASTFRAGMSVSFAPLVAAIVAGALATAFRRGMQLEDDVEGLV